MVLIQISVVDVVLSMESTPDIVLSCGQVSSNKNARDVARTDKTVKLMEDIEFRNIITWLVLDGICLVRKKDSFVSCNLHYCI